MASVRNDLPGMLKNTPAPATFTLELVCGASGSVSIPIPFACKLVSVLGYKDGAGGAGDKVSILRNADLIGEVDCDAADEAFVSLGSRDAANAAFREGDSLVATSSSGASILYATLVRTY